MSATPCSEACCARVHGRWDVFDGVTLRGKIVVDERDDDSEPGRAVYEFRNVRTADGSELSPDDFDVRHRVSKITVFREDGSSFEI